MDDDEPGASPQGPLKGMLLTAVMTAVSATILSRFDLPYGLEGYAGNVGVLGLIGGSVMGWGFRRTLKEFSLIRATFGFFLLGLVAALLIFILVNSYIGTIAGSLIILSVALFTLSIGALCAIAGIKIAE